MSVRSRARRLSALRQHQYPPDHPAMIEARALWVEAKFDQLADQVRAGGSPLPPDVRTRLVTLVESLGADQGRAA